MIWPLMRKSLHFLGVGERLKILCHSISDCAFSYDAGMQEGRGDLSILSLIHGFLKFASVREKR